MKSLSLTLPAFIAALVATPCFGGVTLTAMSTFGGGDGWRAPGEVLAGDVAGSAAGAIYLYLGTASLERGLAYNLGFDKLVLVSRNTGVNIRQLSPLTGEDLGPVALGTGVVTGGAFAASTVACGADGTTYVANLTTNATTTNFKIYKWADIGDPAPTVFFNAAVTGFSAGARLGDSLDLFDAAGGHVLTAGCSGTTGYAVLSASGSSSVATFAPIGPASGDFRLGITFGPTADSVWGRQTTATSGRRTTYTGSSGAYSGSLPLTVAGEAAMDYAVVDGKPLLAVMDMNVSGLLNRAVVRIYDMTTPSAPALVVSGHTTTGSITANGNGVGAIHWGAISGTSAKLYAMATNNGIQAFDVTVTPDVVAPQIAGSPAGRRVYERGQTTLTVSATGSPPFTYAWTKDGVAVSGAPGASLTINPFTAANAGSYICTVGNSAGSASSVAALVESLPSMDTNALTECWHVSPGTRPYLTTDDTQRSLDANAANTKLYLVSRTPTPAVRVLNAADGSDLGVLNQTDVSGGFFLLSAVGVAGDGAIYATNLSIDASNVKVYRWADDDPATVPTVVYEGNAAGGRLGDNIDVRGSGAGTQILLGSRSLNSFVVLTGDPAATMTAANIITDAPAASFGLSAAFGPGDTVWGKTNGSNLVYCSYDLATASGTVIKSWSNAGGVPASVAAIGFDSTTGLLAALQVDNSDNTRLYQLPQPFSPPDILTLCDQEFFPTDNTNAQNTGAVSISGGKVFSLSTGNGIVCYSTTRPEAPTFGLITRDPVADTVSFVLRGTAGKTYLIETTDSLAGGSWTADGAVTLTAPEQTITRSMSPVRKFIRVREK